MKEALYDVLLDLKTVLSKKGLRGEIVSDRLAPGGMYLKFAKTVANKYMELDVKTALLPYGWKSTEEKSFPGGYSMDVKMAKGPTQITISGSHRPGMIFSLSVYVDKV